MHYRVRNYLITVNLYKNFLTSQIVKLRVVLHLCSLAGRPREHIRNHQFCWVLTILAGNFTIVPPLSAACLGGKCCVFGDKKSSHNSDLLSPKLPEVPMNIRLTIVHYIDFI